MIGDSTPHLQNLLDRVQLGDPSACKAFFERAYQRLQPLTRSIFHQDFPRLKNLHETDSILNEAVVKLWDALPQVPPLTIPEFLSLAAERIRWVLLDITRDLKKRKETAYPGGVGEGNGSAGTSQCRGSSHENDPETIALWTEFHQKVEELPEGQREVFQWHWYLGLSQREIAERLALHEREVSRRWIHAKKLLIDWLPGLDELVSEPR